MSANLNFVFVSDFPRRMLTDFDRTLADHKLEQRTLLTVTDAELAKVAQEHADTMASSQ